MQYATFDFMASGNGPQPGGTVDGSKIHCGQVTVVSKGTPVQLTSEDTPLEGGVWFYPMYSSGTKLLYIGTTDFKPTETTGLVFPAATNFYVETNNLKHLWLDANEGSVHISYMAC